MSRPIYRVLAVAAVVGVAACSQGTTDLTSRDLSLLDGAYTSTPVGFSATTNTFASGSDSAWHPDGHRGRGGPGGPGGIGGLLGGGLGLDFHGGIGFGPGRGRGPFGEGGGNSCTGTYSAATGVFTCASTTTREGLTVTRTFAYTTTAGTAQAAYDTGTTNTVKTHTAVSGTATRRDSSKTVVSHVSDRTVSGLATAATQRTVNGTSAGTETTTGTNSTGAYTASRTVGDTVVGIVIPLTAGKETYPTAGTITRHMKATITYTGQAAQTSERREVITYDGSTTAKVTVTQDGTTKTCTITLPNGRPNCS
jgi:hypothetical protein